MKSVGPHPSRSTLYVGGIFDQIAGQARVGLAAISVGTGLASAFDANCNEEVYSLALDGSTLYLGMSSLDMGAANP